MPFIFTTDLRWSKRASGISIMSGKQNIFFGNKKTPNPLNQTEPLRFQTAKGKRPTRMNTIKALIFLPLFSLVTTSFSALPEFSFAVHPASLFYTLKVDNAAWLSVSFEEQVSPALSLVLTPTVYHHRYATHSESWFGGGPIDKKGSDEAYALYLGPRYYIGESDGLGPYVQGLLKYSYHK